MSSEVGCALILKNFQALGIRTGTGPATVFARPWAKGSILNPDRIGGHFVAKRPLSNQDGACAPRAVHPAAPGSAHVAGSVCRGCEGGCHFAETVALSFAEPVSHTAASGVAERKVKDCSR